MIEAIHKIESILGYKMDYTLLEENRIGDHIWYISDVSKFQKDYPQWQYEYDCDKIIKEMIENELNK